MSVAARLSTTAIAGLAAFGAVGIYTLLAGPAATYADLAILMILFTAVYVPGVFASRRLLDYHAIQTRKGMSVPTQ